MMQRLIRISTVGAIFACAAVSLAPAAERSVPVTVVNQNHEPIPTIAATGTHVAISLETSGTAVYQVPSAKHLEIDTVSYLCFTGASTTATYLNLQWSIGTSLANFFFNLPVRATGTFSGNAQPNLWIPPGAQLSVGTGFDGGGYADCALDILGQLFPAS